MFIDIKILFHRIHYLLKQDYILASEYQFSAIRLARGQYPASNQSRKNFHWQSTVSVIALRSRSSKVAVRIFGHFYRRVGIFNPFSLSVNEAIQMSKSSHQGATDSHFDNFICHLWASRGPFFNKVICFLPAYWTENESIGSSIFLPICFTVLYLQIEAFYFLTIFFIGQSVGKYEFYPS